jgi:hypothetical protein
MADVFRAIARCAAVRTGYAETHYKDDAGSLARFVTLPEAT